jgi:predicted permease
MFSDVLFRLRAILRRDNLERDLAEELRLHLDRQLEMYLRQGLPPEEARRRARLDLGGVEQIKEECRDARGVAFWETLVRDLRYATRMYRKNPGFTAIVVCTLALGIGATTALFGIVHDVLLMPLPYAEPDRLVQVWEDPSGTGTGRNSVSARVFAGWKQQTTSLENISAIRRDAQNLTGEGSAERLRGFQVSANFLDIFRTSPALGRGFAPDEDQAGQDGVVILAHSVWRSKFGGDRGVIGRSVRLGGRNRTVIGVLPLEPRLLDEPDYLVPFVYGSEAWHAVVRDHRLHVVARITRTASLAQAREEMRLITERMKPIYPPHMKDWSVVLVPLQEELTGEIRPTLLVLFGATALVLLIACANVANLLLARVVSRRREMCVRMALGAGRAVVLRQFLTESIGLSLTGCAAGLLLAYAGIEAFNRSPLSLPGPGLEAKLSVGVFVFASLLSLCTGLASGLAPALLLSRANLDGLGEGRGVGSATISGRVRRVLIVTEIALALLLLAGAGLLLQTTANLRAIPLGFDPRGVLAMDISLEGQYSAGEERTRFYTRAIQQIEGLPGVVAAGMATTLPMAGSTDAFVTVEGRANQFDTGASTDYDFVGGHYFRAMDIRLGRGRVFGPRDDDRNVPGTVVLNESLARALFPAEDPIGRHVRFIDRVWEVIGIVADVQQRGLGRRATHHVYLPQAFSTWSGSLVVRSRMDPQALAEAIRRTITAIDPDQPVSNARTLDEIVAASIGDQRMMLAALGVFAATALLLAAIGFYGVISYSVSLRRQEIAVRLALGASRTGILALVVGEGARLTAVGVVLGLLSAVALTRVLTHVLFNVTPTDPLTLLVAMLLLIAVALTACYLPARRASAIDPTTALRCD